MDKDVRPHYYDGTDRHASSVQSAVMAHKSNCPVCGAPRVPTRSAWPSSAHDVPSPAPEEHMSKVPDELGLVRTGCELVQARTQKEGSPRWHGFPICAWRQDS